MILILTKQIGETCRSVVNDKMSIDYCDNMDIITRFARDLENEGIELSNDKILKILVALHSLISTFYRVYIKTLTEQE